jgi:hypothetical protein
MVFGGTEVPVVYILLCRPSEDTLQGRAIPDGSPSKDWQSTVGWGDCWIRTQDYSFTIWCHYQWPTTAHWILLQLRNFLRCCYPHKLWDPCMTLSIPPPPPGSVKWCHQTFSVDVGLQTTYRIFRNIQKAYFQMVLDILFYFCLAPSWAGQTRLESGGTNLRGFAAAETGFVPLQTSQISVASF